MSKRNININIRTNQINEYDERWYEIERVSDKGKRIELIAVLPSWTWIAGYTEPKEKEFLDWLMRNGLDAEDLRNLRGEEGAEFHDIVYRFFKGEEISYS